MRRALHDPAAGVRQAAARSAGLHKDAQAATRLAEMVTSDEPAVRREAATALGRIGDVAAVPALLAAMDATDSDRFLEHAVIFALIRIDNQPATAKGLELAQPAAKRGALVALDQMDGGRLSPEAVTPFLSAADPLLQQSALWVIAHHADWGRNMVGFFDDWLDDRDMNDARRDELKRQLLAFASDQHVQELIGRTLADANTPRATQLLLLEVIGQSSVNQMPTSWIAGLQRSLADADDATVGHAVAALRSLHLDKRPIDTKIEPQVEAPPTLPIPDPAAGVFDELLLHVAAASQRADALRAQAAAAVVGHLTSIDPPLFGFLLASVDESNGPLLRMDAADALAAAPLDHEQLFTLCDTIATAGGLEVPRLVQAFAAGKNESVGMALVAALKQSPGGKSLAPRRWLEYCRAIRAHPRQRPAALRATARRLGTAKGPARRA